MTCDWISIAGVMVGVFALGFAFHSILNSVAGWRDERKRKNKQ